MTCKCFYMVKYCSTYIHTKILNKPPYIQPVRNPVLQGLLGLAYSRCLQGQDKVKSKLAAAWKQLHHFQFENLPRQKLGQFGKLKNLVNTFTCCTFHRQNLITWTKFSK